jgi:RNA polymerase sigma-70 factor (ECF subfamily)
MPMFLWLRFLTGQKLLQLHRRHLGVQARNAGREVSCSRWSAPEASSATLAAWLVGRLSSPSHAAARAELCSQLHTALDQIEPLDREILVLRHFEQLTNAEVAHVLGIQESAASKRYVRALERLKGVLQPSA